MGRFDCILRNFAHIYFMYMCIRTRISKLMAVYGLYLYII
jgi:hypothetical protein